MNDTTILAYGELLPSIDKTVFLAEGVRIIGDVIILEESGVWFNTVIRGDVNRVRIGRRTNIQDGCVLHVSSGPADLLIGDYVTVGHMACLHGCKIGDYSLVGIGSTVLDNAVVEPRSMVAAGSLVPPGFRVPSGKLVAGVPAKVIRDLRQEELDYFAVSANHYYEYARAMMHKAKE